MSQAGAEAGPPLVAGPAAIEVGHLTKDFGGRAAVADVSFSVARGEVFGFLGPNGAGETKTMRILDTLIAATAGSATVAGIPVGPASAAQIRRRISIMPESPGLYQRLTVTENSAYAVVGECDQGILEPALTTPVGRAELIIGEAVAIFLPTVALLPDVRRLRGDHAAPRQAGGGRRRAARSAAARRARASGADVVPGDAGRSRWPAPCWRSTAVPACWWPGLFGRERLVTGRQH